MKQFYSKFHLVFISIFFFSISISAQRGEKLWTKTTKESLSKSQKVFRKTEPTKATFYKLDINGLKTILQNAPKRNEFTGTSNVIASFPNAEGSFEAYRILEASVMNESLQEKHPNIRSYVGQSIENPASIIRFSLTTQGLHTMTLSSNIGAQFIDPYSKNDNSYIIYAKRDLPRLKDEFICEVIDEISTKEDDTNNLFRNTNDGKLREFDLAIACTIEYSSFHWMAAGLNAGDTKAAKKVEVLTAMVVTMTRVNGVYERDLSITMLMVDNDAIIFINSDNFSNDNANSLISESQTVINAAIGSLKYDIGHTFSTGGGGLATPGVCQDAIKARGITGSSVPVGNPYNIDFVAHEIGHQFSANHTFNGDTGNCTGGNRNPSTAYEPGSGTTIMAYAGICSPQNVQNNSDAYFHQASIAEMWTYITDGSGTCADPQTATGNAAPIANAGGDYTIPISTPYKLKGSSTDTDGTESHTFTWEQYDLGDAGLPTEGDLSGGPLVRTYEGTTNPVRYIPRLTDVLNNGGVSTTWEKLASVSRDINFQLTVRDNGMTGGQTDSDGMIVTTDASAGPFTVTSQASSGISWPVGSTQTVTWNVANTNMAPVNASNVNIWLSTDGGATFTVPLASGVPNNGSYEISSVPNNIGPYCRIMVEGANNIFYNVNTIDFAVGYTVVSSCTQYASNPNLNLPILDGTGTSMNPIAGPPLFNTINVPDSNTIDYIRINADISHNRISDLLIQIQHPDGSTFMNPWSLNCGNENDLDIIFEDGASAIVCAQPTIGTYDPNSPLSVFNGLDSAGNWNIVVVDFINMTTGTLNDWYVEVCSTTVTLSSLDVFGLDSFSVYPNPNNGEFTVKLNSSSSNKIKINVYDIRGRKVFDNSYSNSSNFNKVVNLNNVQSGIYILKVSDGERSGTKKIIVN